MTDSALLSRLASRGSWRLRTKKKKPTGTRIKDCAHLEACVSQETIDRLMDEAGANPAFQGMEPDELKAYVKARLDEFLRPYPWWAGNLLCDRKKKPASEAQREALAKARQRKRDIQAEAEAPYVVCERDIPYHGAFPGEDE